MEKNQLKYKSITNLLKMFNTEIHPLTFLYICIQSVLVFPATFNLLNSRYKKFHMEFFLLLICILLNNISSGLLPDINLPINMLSQNIIAYFVGFISLIYYFIYVSKYYNINFRKYIKVNQIFLILFVDLVLGFIIPYTITNDLEISRNIFLLIPILLIALLFIIILKEKITIYFKYSNVLEKYHVFTGIMGIISVISVPITMLVLGDNQDIEQTFLNLGFFFIAIEYFLYQKSVKSLVVGVSSRNGKYLGLMIESIEIRIL